MIEKKNIIKVEEKAVLVGVIVKDQTEEQVDEYLAELAFLSETAGAIAVKLFKQKLQHPDSKTFVGKGKLEEIKQYVLAKDIDIVIFDDELTGIASQGSGIALSDFSRKPETLPCLPMEGSWIDQFSWDNPMRPRHHPWKELDSPIPRQSFDCTSQLKAQ